MLAQVDWGSITVAGAFILGLLVGIVLVLRVARVGAHLIDRYIDHRLGSRDKHTD